ncbi:hypothetical protein ACGF0J_28485 [Nonomuraea sp. NPDC047897]|uniref:hypothetical protein n=1 Tax=Nonomuraea sp. NPDC047897 TaxID=3364346 RepID=UPI0037123E38
MALDGGGGVGDRFASWWRGVAAALAGAAVASSSACGLIEEQRFDRSVADMERVARTIRTDDDPAERPREIGWITFEDVYRDGDRVYFKLDDIGGVDPYGYVYSPAERPADNGPVDSVHSTFEHIRGPWYHWSDSY